MALPKANFYVVSTEYERGWGRKDFHVAGYMSKEKALAAIKATNDLNKSPKAPDYYIQDRLEVDDHWAEHREYGGVVDNEQT